MDLISRPNYYSKLEKLLGKGVLIVLTGQRRVGKSYVMKELVARKQQEPNANVIYIDKEKTAFDTIVTYKDLVTYVEERLDKSKHNYLLIDEVQEIEEFERGLRNYYNESFIDVVVTGSNSDILSSDLGTMLSGRYVEVFIQGLSYPEFLEFHNLEDGEAAINKYINYGGLPGLRPFGLDNPETINDYLQGVYNTILVKDIIRRKKIRNVPFLENLIRFIADNIGKPMSATSIQNYMTSNESEVSKNLILKYMNGFDQRQMLVNFALTGSMDYAKTTGGNFGEKNDANMHGKSAAVVWFLLKNGKIANIKGLEFVKSHPSVDFVIDRFNVGDEVTPNMLGTERQVFLRIFLHCENKAELTATLRDFQSNLAVTNENGESLILPSLLSVM